MASCAVKTCRNSGLKAKNNGKVMFFRFSKDPVLCEQWKIACGRPDMKTEHGTNIRLCYVGYYILFIELYTFINIKVKIC